MLIYADNAATTKMSRTAIEAMLPYLDEIYGNPSSLHSAGRRAKDALMDARQRAMLLYPFIQNGTISHGRAAEILGMSKWSLIQLYGLLGIPFIDMEVSELNRDIAVALAASESR